jgi:hypothetical protein
VADAAGGDAYRGEIGVVVAPGSVSTINPFTRSFATTLKPCAAFVSEQLAVRPEPSAGTVKLHVNACVMPFFLSVKL